MAGPFGCTLHVWLLVRLTCAEPGCLVARDLVGCGRVRRLLGPCVKSFIGPCVRRALRASLGPACVKGFIGPCVRRSVWPCVWRLAGQCVKGLVGPCGCACAGRLRPYAPSGRLSGLLPPFSRLVAPVSGLMAPVRSYGACQVLWRHGAGGRCGCGVRLLWLGTRLICVASWRSCDV